MNRTEKMLREQEREVERAIGCLALLIFGAGLALGVVSASLVWWLCW